MTGKPEEIPLESSAIKELQIAADLIIFLHNKVASVAYGHQPNTISVNLLSVFKNSDMPFQVRNSFPSRCLLF